MQNLKEPQEVLIIWIGQVHKKMLTAADEVIKKHAKVHGQQMSVTNFDHKNYYTFCSKKKQW
jgi:hypothetical protein